MGMRGPHAYGHAYGLHPWLWLLYLLIWIVLGKAQKGDIP